MNFGTHYINFEAIKTINIENRGKKTQKIKCDNYPPLKVKKVVKGNENAPGSTGQKEVKKEIDDEPKLCFGIDKLEDEKSKDGVTATELTSFTITCRAKSSIPLT